MANTNALSDRNLLFGILAVQMDFIGRDALIAAMNAWVLDKARPLGQILVEQKALAAERQALLEALVQEHLRAHGNDPEKSLTAVGCAGPVRAALQQVADADIHGSLASFTRTGPPEGDIFATRTAPVGQPTGTGSRFRILRPHARGGLGEVLVAEDAELHREVALKQIQDKHADSPESRARFLMEAEITGGLEHPGIVPVYGLGQYGDGRPYYAMRFIRGHSLKDTIAQFHKADPPGGSTGERGLELRQLLSRFLDVCDAIAYAHSRGVLHRDLKPSNIMLGEFGETLVVDWGLAKVLGHAETKSEVPPLAPHSSASITATLPGQMTGTPAYMAPEQASGRLDLMDERTDIYCLGGILFEILSGQAPHQGQNAEEVLKDILANPTPRLRALKPSASPALDAICARAMAGLRADRYGKASDLASDVRRFLADEPVTAWREPWTLRTRRWLSRHRTLATATGATVLVATALLAVATIFLNQAWATAERNYQHARAAVERYYTEVSENILLEEPGMEPLRKKLLEIAREFYAKFVEERKNDPNARADLGKGLFRLAQITADVESMPKAIDQLCQARDIFADLADAHPDIPEHRSDLARCFHHLGRLSRETDQLGPAEKAFKNALELWKRLDREFPRKSRIHAEYARSWFGLGNVYQATLRLREALTPYQKALTIREAQARADPKNDKYRRDLAINYNNLAQVYQALGQEEKAEGNFRKALTIRKELAGANKTIKQYQNDLARSFADLGQLYLRMDQIKESKDSYREAETILKKLTRSHAAVIVFQSDLAYVYEELTNAFLAGKEVIEAEKTCQQSMEIRKKLAKAEPDLPVRQWDLAKGYYEEGKVAQVKNVDDKAETAYRNAALILEKLIVEHPGVLPYQCYLANTYNALGILNNGNRAAAHEFLNKALVLWKSLAAVHPENVEFQLGLCACYVYLGNLANDTEKYQLALDWYNRAVATLKTGTPRLDKQKGSQPTRFFVYWHRAEILMKLNMNREAVEDWDQVIALAPKAEQAYYRFSRTRAAAMAGDHARAAAEAWELAKESLQSGEGLYQLAVVYAQCLNAVGKDAGLNLDLKKKKTEEYASQALDLLEKAQKAGFKDTANRLKTDPSLDPLRARADFKNFLNKVLPENMTKLKGLPQ